MELSRTYFTIYVIQTIMLYALNLLYANYFSIKLEKIYFYLVNWKDHKANFNKSQINKNNKYNILGSQFSKNTFFKSEGKSPPG